MRKVYFFIFISLCLGLLYGILQWSSFYQRNAQSTVFRGLDVVSKKRVLHTMIAHQKFTDVLSWLRSVYPDEEPSAHGIGHLLGEVAYQIHGNKAFGLCDTVFNYGCYHGVIDMAIRTKGLHVSLATELKDACASEMKDPSPCIHPLGHASMILSQYDGFAAFHLCDTLYPEPKVAASCWDGAMMEYINRSAPNAPSSPYGNPSDPYYPCNTFPAKYEASCVRMHLSYLETGLGYSYTRLVSYCLTFTRRDTIDACVDEAGSLAAQAYFLRPSEAIAVCDTASTHRFSCIMGVVVPFAIARQKTSATTVCQALAAQSELQACYERMNDMLR